jgi:hypothetical protein
LGEEICTALSFKGYYTIKYESWPKDLDEDSFKGIGHKLKSDKHEGQVEEHASSHVEDVCIEEDRTKTYDTPLELTNGVNDTSVLYGYDYVEVFKSVKYEDTTSCPTYDGCKEMFQSTNVEDPTSFFLYDAYDEDGSSMIAPTHDEYSTSYPIYDVHNDQGSVLMVDNKTKK